MRGNPPAAAGARPRLPAGPAHPAPGSAPRRCPAPASPSARAAAAAAVPAGSGHMPLTRQQKRKTRSGRGAEGEGAAAGAAKAAGRQRSARGRAARAEGRQARSGLPAHPHVQISTARLCAKRGGSPPRKARSRRGEGSSAPCGGSFPRSHPGAAAERSAAQAKRLVGRGSPPSAAAAPPPRETGGARPAPRPRPAPAAADRHKPARRRLRAHAGRPAGPCPAALLLLLPVAGGRCPAGKPGELLPRRPHRPARTTAQPSRRVGMYARCVEREYTTDTCKREI